MFQNEDEIEWDGDATSGRPDWRATFHKGAVSLGDMDKYYYGFTSAVLSRDLFLKAGPESKEQSIAHTW